MLNRRSAPFFYTAMLIFGLAIGLPLGWGFLHFEHSPEPPVHLEQTHAKTQANCCAVPKEPSSWFVRAADDPIAVFSGALVIITLLLAIYTYGLFATTADIATDAKDSSERQLRAYLVIDAARVHSGEFYGTRQPLAAGRIPQVLLKVRNTGQTPATHVRHSLKIQFLPRPLDESSLRAPKTPKQGFTLGAGRRWNFRGNGAALRSAQISELEGETSALFVYGEVRYRDVFKEERWTRFRMFVTGTEAIADMHLSPHETGNETDYDHA